jgi:hypothetical protein
MKRSTRSTIKAKMSIFAAEMAARYLINTNSVNGYSMSTPAIGP